MMITSYCLSGCKDVSTISYQWYLYRYFQASQDDIQEKWIPFVNKTYLTGLNILKLCR